MIRPLALSTKQPPYFQPEGSEVGTGAAVVVVVVVVVTAAVVVGAAMVELVVVVVVEADAEVFRIPATRARFPFMTRLPTVLLK